MMNISGVFNMAKNLKKEFYLKRIEEAQNGAELDHIIEVAAYDDTISHKEYGDIYVASENRMREIYGWE